MTVENIKHVFTQSLNSFVVSLQNDLMTADGQWAIKGFIDAYKNIYTISSDTKLDELWQNHPNHI